MKKLLAILLAALMLPVNAAMSYADASFETELPMEPDEELPASVFEEPAEPVELTGRESAAPSAILVERETGRVLYEKNADERLEPASVTKVMTILLIVEAVEAGTLRLDENVTASARAASMGGSQVFLREGEQMAVSELLKCVPVASANDAAEALAEHLAGTEAAFVQRMNARAAELGMTNTHFSNCTGLLDDPEHLTTARDIAVMSRELIRHRWIRDYTTIWMDTIRGGTFGLSSTNKLIRFYPGATGLKTGYTSSAGHCIAATAERDGVEYIAVVLHCQSSADRFESAKTLLSCAFQTWTLADAWPDEVLPPIPVTLGADRYVQPEALVTGPVLVKKSEAGSVTRTVELAKELTAPVKAGQKVGTLTVSANGETLGTFDIVAMYGVEKRGWWDVVCSMLGMLFLGKT